MFENVTMPASVIYNVQSEISFSLQGSADIESFPQTMVPESDPTSDMSQILPINVGQ